MTVYRQKIGQWGEDLAAAYLIKKGYSILEKNYRAERGEIDVIAQDGDMIVFVEVKSSSHNGFGEPEARVDKKKQRQIGKVAAAYLSNHNLNDVDCRFDVIAIQRIDGIEEIKHIQDAFWLESE